MIGLGAYGAVALAENPRFVDSPTCTGAGTQVRCSGSIAGLDDDGAAVRLKVTAVGIADVICDEAGGRRLPNRQTTTVSLADVELGRPRGGRLVFRRRKTQQPAEATGADACPGARRGARIVDVGYTTATLRVLQGREVVVGPMTVTVK